MALVSSVFRLEIARGYLALALPLGLVALTVNRMLARRYVATQRRKGRFANSVLAVGHLSSARALVKSLARQPEDGYRVVGVCVPGGNFVPITCSATRGPANPISAPGSASAVAF